MNTSIKSISAGKHIYGLDGLRALAIIGVTLFHMFPNTIKGGYLGVSLFFVISGYLLAVNCESRKKQGTYRVIPFYLKRIKRIYPALIIVLLASAGLYFFLERDVLNGFRPEFLSILCGYNNWWQIAQNADYFTRITNASPFTHMWFLAIELQFYLIWPVIFGVFILLQKRAGRRASLLFILILTVISIVLTPIMYRPGNDVTRLYYGTDTRMYALLLGVLIGFLKNRRLLPELPVRLARALWIPMAAVMIVVTWIAYVLLDGQYGFTYRGGMLLMTLLFCVLLALVTDRRIPLGKLLEAPLLVWIGQRSYEIYLWQYPIIFLFLYKRWDRVAIYPVFEIILIVILAVWLHWFTDAILGLKVPDSVRLLDRRKQLILLAAALATAFFCVFGVAGIATAKQEKFAEKDELQQRLEENQKMLQENQNQGTGNSTAAGDSSLSAEPETAQTTTPATQTAATNLEFADPSLTNSAEVSKEGVLMIGDSIMLDSSPQLKEEFPDCYIDAVQSRQLVDSVEVAQGLIYDGLVNKTVVISLGTNGPIQDKDARAMLDTFGPDVSVFWVNLFGRTVTWEKEANQYLLDLTKEYPNLTIVNWCDLIKEHPEWLWGDGEHPNPDGSAIFAQLIRESMDATIANQQNGTGTGATSTSADGTSTDSASTSADDSTEDTTATDWDTSAAFSN